MNIRFLCSRCCGILIPFDQWGVEKGKEIANQLLPILNREQDDLSKFDASTQGLLKILLGKTDG